MRIASGVVDQLIYFVAVDGTDFTTRETGLASFTVFRSRNGGTAAAMTTPTVNEVDATNMPGVYELLLDEDMTIDAGDETQEMAFHVTHAGMAPVTRTIELFRPKITAGNTLGVAADGDLLEVNTLTGHTAQTGDSFARLGAPAGASVSADIAVIEGQTDDIGVAGAGLTAIPNLDAAVSTRATPAQVNTEVDAALNTVIPGTPTADSINERIAAIDDLLQAAGAGDAAAIKAKTDSLVFTTAGKVDARVDNWAGAAVTLSATSAKPEVDAFSISDDAAAADSLERSAEAIVPVTIGTGSDTDTIVASSLGGEGNDTFNGRRLYIVSGALAGETGEVVDYVDNTTTGTLEFPTGTFTGSAADGDLAVLV